MHGNPWTAGFIKAIRCKNPPKKRVPPQTGQRAFFIILFQKIRTALRSVYPCTGGTGTARSRAALRTGVAKHPRFCTFSILFSVCSVKKTGICPDYPIKKTSAQKKYGRVFARAGRSFPKGIISVLRAPAGAQTAKRSSAPPQDRSSPRHSALFLRRSALLLSAHATRKCWQAPAWRRLIPPAV